VSGDPTGVKIAFDPTVTLANTVKLAAAFGVAVDRLLAATS
jgi:hypothetical protein